MYTNETLPATNVRSRTFYVARTRARCWHCGLSTCVLGLALPHGHEILDQDAQTDVSEHNGATPQVWQRVDTHAFIFYVEELPEHIQRGLNQLSPSFRLAPSPATLNSYWANHCEHCESLLDDHELHCEPDGAFVPSSEGAAVGIQLVHVQAPFQAAAAGHALEPEFFGFMPKSW
jgi:hypothetical protein